MSQTRYSMRQKEDDPKVSESWDRDKQSAVRPKKSAQSDKGKPGKGQGNKK